VWNRISRLIKTANFMGSENMSIKYDLISETDFPGLVNFFFCRNCWIWSYIGWTRAELL